jgi:selenide,water dikinase
MVGKDLGQVAGVHALTDVTGFGLFGHALEMARGAGLSAHINAGAVPLLPGVEALARAGVRTGAAVRNWDSYGDAVILPAGFDSWRRDLLCDPQTSGGLLISAAPEATQEVLTMVRDAGFAGSAIVGELATGSPGIVVV